MNRIKELLSYKKASNLYSSIFAIFAGLIFGLIIMLIVNPGEAFPALNAIIFSGFSSLRRFGDVLYFAAPICLTGLSVAFAFKTGLFNIGASGQFFVGGYAAIYTGVHFGNVLGPFTFILCIIVAGIFGALWGMIPGLLKAYRNVNEVVSTIMMNYIGLYLVIYHAREYTYNRLINTTLPVEANSSIPYFGLDKIFVGSSIQGTIFIAIIATIVIHIILSKTVLGYELKAVGHNKEAAKYAGISEKKAIVISMMIAGALAGVAGAAVYLARTGDFIKVAEELPNFGFEGIAVALLGHSSAIGTFISSLFFGLLKVGGEQMQLFSFSKEIINIISSSIIYFSALSLVFKTFMEKIYQKIELKRGEK